MSISSIDKGRQVRTFQYRNPASSASFNRLLTDILPSGVYAGGLFTRLSGTVISISKLVALVHSNEREADRIFLRFETTEDQDLSLAVALGGATCDPERCYVVARFGWEDVESDFLDFIAVKYSNDPHEYRPDYIMPKDLILGKIEFVQQNSNWIIQPQNSFDYTRRSRAFIPDENALYSAFKVQTSETANNKVHVTGGSIATSKCLINVTGGDFPINGLPPTDNFGRYDLVYVDANGNIEIEIGTPSATPIAPVYGNRRILAEIRRGANRADVIGDDIVQINPLGQSGTIEAKDFSIIDSQNYFTRKNVENALEQTWEKALELEELLEALTLFSENTQNDLNEHVADVVDFGIIHGIEICHEIALV